MNNNSLIYERTIQLIGESAFERLQATRVILFGAGGVGGWCAEALVRTGIGHLTIVDFDEVAPSNLNRQIVATQDTLGKPKSEALAARLSSIYPKAEIVALQARYTAETAAIFQLQTYDYVIDAIDQVEDKMHLIWQATETEGVTLFSSMGAGRKMDPQQIRVAEFGKVEGCPLARALRTRMRKAGHWPKRKFRCVYSPELSGERGTIAPVVGTFGMMLAGLVIRDLIDS